MQQESVPGPAAGPGSFIRLKNLKPALNLLICMISIYKSL